MKEPMTLQDAKRMARDLGLSTDDRDMTRFITSHSLFLDLADDAGSTEFYSSNIEPLQSFMTLLAPHFPGSHMVIHRCHKEYTVADELRP